MMEVKHEMVSATSADASSKSTQPTTNTTPIQSAIQSAIVSSANNSNANANHQLQLQNQVQDSLSMSLGRTLLPSPLASVVSTTIHTASASIRVGTWVGGLYISAGKYAVVQGISGAQYLLRGALGLAASEVAGPSSAYTQGYQSEADHILAHTFAHLHYKLTQAAFWTIAGLNASKGSIETVSSLAVAVLDHLNHFLGSTDSSRAVASIIDMTIREFRNPATASPGEKVDSRLLFASLCSLIYLQNRCCKRKEELEFRASLEELLWDVVVLDDGSRVDVNGLRVSYNSQPRPGMPLDAVEQHGIINEQDGEEDPPETTLKHQIMRSLPPDASVDIATTTTVTKTISLEVKGTDVLPFKPPPGAEIVEQVRLPHLPRSSDLSCPAGEQPPTFRVVYRVEKHTAGDAKIQGHIAYEGRPSREASDVTEGVADMDTSVREGEDAKVSGEAPLEVPPEPPTHVQQLHSPTLSDRNSDDLEPPSPAVEITTATSADMNIKIPSTSKGSIILPRGKTPPSSRPTSPSKAKIDTKVPQDIVGNKKGGFRAALKRGPGSAISSLLHKESTTEKSGEDKSSLSRKAPQVNARKCVVSASRLPIPKRNPSSSRPAISRQQKGIAASIGRDPGPYSMGLDGAGISRPASRASFISVHETKRDSMLSQTDTWSIHSRDGLGDDLRPLSPAVVRKEVGSQGSNIAKSPHFTAAIPNNQPPNTDNLVTIKGFCPTIYTLKTRASSASLLTPSIYQSAFQDATTIRRLQRTGMINETFPKFHLLRNVLRYMRFSSATYGSMFLSTMGIGKRLERAWEAGGHQELNVFAHHTGIPRKDILMASFVDAQGGTDATGSTNTNMPLVHYVTVDHESKAIVLACRGTMGFEDVLTDLMCQYDALIWQRKPYKVHKGIHASAKRILYGRDGRVLMQLKKSLEEHKEYGLVLTGHSLGGGVTALLGIMLAEPSPTGFGFVTSSQPHQHLLEDGKTVDTTKEHIFLPAGRPIHVYTYGPPGSMAPRLQKATRGLITSVVHGNDVVPYLSLGVLHDLQCVGLTFKAENGDLVKNEFVSRVWDMCQGKVSRVWHGDPAYDTREGELRGDEKAVAALKTIRANMTNGKLVPPGEVFAVETSKVLRRDAYVVDGNKAAHIGRMATRVVFKYVKDVEQRFNEIRFGMHMLVDHSPGRYEDALNRLCSGVAGPTDDY